MKKINKPIIIYEYMTTRNKLNGRGRTPIAIKSSLIKERGKICYVCERYFDRLQQLQLDHKIPVEVGGHLFLKENVGLICIKCHVKKTRIDIKTINILKKSRIISGRGCIRSYFPRRKVINMYRYFKELVEEIQIKQEIYDNGSNGEDYIQYQDKFNRE